MKQEIINCLTWLANRVSETTTYKSWSDEFKCKEVKKSMDKFVEELKKHIDFSNLTEEDCRELRFKRWDEESDIMLIPLYLVPAIPIGTTLTSISGEDVIYDGHNIDLDIRFGCIAYGIKPKK